MSLGQSNGAYLLPQHWFQGITIVNANVLRLGVKPLAIFYVRRDTALRQTSSLGGVVLR